jgi:adenosylcobinamide-phosphate synthase
MAGRRVQRELLAGDLSGARRQLPSLCSRGASELAESEVAAAAVASLAENLSDSFVAPLFFFPSFRRTGRDLLPGCQHA